MSSGTLMPGVVEKLEEAIDFHDIQACGQLGEIYEQVLNDLRSAGNAVRTPPMPYRFLNLQPLPGQPLQCLRHRSGASTPEGNGSTPPLVSATFQSFVSKIKSFGIRSRCEKQPQ
jgi:hypothetical protein